MDRQKAASEKELRQFVEKPYSPGRCRDYTDEAFHDANPDKPSNDKNEVDNQQEMFVDQYYEMNPETEDVLFDGSYLREGMVVLIESPDSRKPVNDFMDDVMTQRARISNRWCTVKMSIINTSENVVAFLAVYDDGVVRKRSHDLTEAWIVKKNSIPSVSLVEDKK